MLYMKLIWCSGFPEIYGQLDGVSLPLVYVHSAIYETYLVQWFSRDLCTIVGRVGVSLPWVYLHSAIYETAFGVQWCCIDLWLN